MYENEFLDFSYLAYNTDSTGWEKMVFLSKELTCSVQAVYRTPSPQDHCLHQFMRNNKETMQCLKSVWKTFVMKDKFACSHYAHKQHL